MRCRGTHLHTADNFSIQEEDETGPWGRSVRRSYSRLRSSLRTPHFTLPLPHRWLAARGEISCTTFRRRLDDCQLNRGNPQLSGFTLCSVNWPQTVGSVRPRSVRVRFWVANSGSSLQVKNEHFSQILSAKPLPFWVTSHPMYNCSQLEESG